MINEEDKRIIEKVQKLNCGYGDVLLFYFKVNQFIDLDKVQQCFKTITAALPKEVSVLMLPDNIQLFSVENCKSTIESLQNWISQAQKAIDKVGDIKNEKFSHDVILDFKGGGIRQRDFYTCGPRIIEG